MTNKQHFILKMSFIIKHKDDRIRILMMGQEALEIFIIAEKKNLENTTEEILVDEFNHHLLQYARNPQDDKDLVNDLAFMCDQILD